jgi:hypothetical protein
MANYRSEFISIDRLGPALKRELEDLYLAHYEASSPGVFQADLARKDEVLVIRHQSKVIGFSSLAYHRLPWAGRDLRIIFSGDTIVQPEHWGQMALTTSWLAHMGSLARSEPESPMYWLLIVKGHRTFRYLPAYLLHFFPHWEREEPDLAHLAHHLGRHFFQAAYDPRTGVAAWPESRGQLKPHLAEPDPDELARPEVRYFLERNPGYRRGEEMLCLAPMNADNLRPFGRRIFEKGEAKELG